jgi:hypothetical protein
MSPVERKVIPLHALPASTLLERYGRLLADPDSIGPHSPLIPAEDIALLQRELRMSLRAATPRESARATATLIGSFQGSMEGLAVFASAMTEELAEYPPDALYAAVRHARRRARALPSVAEMVELCEEEVEPRRRQLRTLERMAEEHTRRNRNASARTLHEQPTTAAAELEKPAPSAPQEDWPLDDWQLAVQELRRLGAGSDEVASFTERLMNEASEIRAEAEAQQAALAAAARARAAAEVETTESSSA